MSMRFIVSPAKKMTSESDVAWRDMPRFLDKSREVARTLAAMSFEELIALWKCSEKLARETCERMGPVFAGAGWDDPSCARLAPALLAYEGIQYQNMAPRVMTSSELEYVQEHLRILSGFYGMLAPFDAVVPYRLEAAARLSVAGSRDLYGFWGDEIYRALAQEADVVVNLASVEYARMVVPHAEREAACAGGEGAPRIVTCLFGEVNGAGKLVQRSTHAKAARGTFVRWCAANEARSTDDLARFNVGHVLDEGRSTEDVLVFVKN